MDKIVNPNAHHKLLAKYATEFASIPNWCYLEIGCCEGASLLTVLRSGGPASCAVCDNWGAGSGGSARGSNQHIRALLAKEPNGHVVTFHDGDSTQIIPPMLDDGLQFQLINVDGDHSYAGAALDLLHCWPMLRPSGVIVLDDIYHPQHTNLAHLVRRFSLTIGVNPEFETGADYGVCAWRKPK